MGERQFGPYTLVHQIAVGGMAEIHLAKTSGIAGFEKYVALKMIHPNFSQDQQFIQMLIDEAKITVQLQHVNIAQTFDLGRVEDTFYITMEYVDGADLYKLLRKGSEQDRDVPVPVCAHIAKEVATGLDYAHRKRDVTGKPLGIVHRDVSPQNVLISYAGEIKLVDFGIAKATMRARQTQVGVIKGKYYYMSPEQAWGEKLDHRTDIFSTGILLYEMLTGQMLYLEEDLHKLLDMVRRADIKPPSTLRKDIPPQLERIVMHALQKKPEDRYQTAGDLATDLERFLHVYAPVFTSTKVAHWMNEVLSSELPPPPTKPPPKEPVEPGRETKRLTRDQLVMTREELPDENSVIFDAQDFARQAAEDRAREAGDETAAAIDAFPAADADDQPTHDETPIDPVSGAPSRSGPEKRAPHMATREIEESRRSEKPAAPSLADLDVGERTVVSGPPGFGDDEEDHPTLDGQGAAARSDPEPDAEVGLETLNEPTLISPSAAEEEDGPTVQHPRAPEREEPDEQEEDLEGPTLLKERRSWEPAPALAARNPKPAVSAIRQPRRSRKTPGKGVPADSGAGGGGSVLSSLLSGPGPKPPRVAMAGTEGQPNPAGPGASGPQPSPAPPTGQGPPIQPGPFPPPAPAAGSPFPNGTPQVSSTRQFAALELDEIPDIYKIDRGRGSRRAWIWGGAVFLVCAAAGVFIGLYGFAGGPEARPATLQLVTIPPGATVTVNGEQLDEKTPTSYARAMGGETYQLAFDLPRHKRHEHEARVPLEGGQHDIVIPLKRITVDLTIASEPTGASVYVNDNPRGTTPLELEGIDPEDARTVELRKKGYQPVYRTLEWDLSDPEQKLMVRLEKQKR